MNETTYMYLTVIFTNHVRYASEHFQLANVGNYSNHWLTGYR